MDFLLVTFFFDVDLGFAFRFGVPWQPGDDKPSTALETKAIIIAKAQQQHADDQSSGETGGADGIVPVWVYGAALGVACCAVAVAAVLSRSS